MFMKQQLGKSLKFFVCVREREGVCVCVCGSYIDIGVCCLRDRLSELKAQCVSVHVSE